MVLDHATVSGEVWIVIAQCSPCSIWPPFHSILFHSIPNTALVQSKQTLSFSLLRVDGHYSEQYGIKPWNGLELYIALEWHGIVPLEWYRIIALEWCGICSPGI